MRHASIIFAALSMMVVQAFAAPPPEPPQPKPLAPAPSRPSWMSGDRSAVSPPLRFPYDSQPKYQPSIWQRVERDLDRSMWRLEDTATYELNRLQLERAANRPNADPEIRRELFEYERDRQIIEDKIHYARGRATDREELMRRREYELWLNDGLQNAIGEQATADRLALQSARQRRDDEVTAATTARDQALREAKDETARATVLRDFETRRTAIEQTYEAERARILGVDTK